MLVHIDKGIVQHDRPHKGGALYAVSIQATDDFGWWNDYFYKAPSRTALKHLAKARIMGKSVFIFSWNGSTWEDYSTDEFVEMCKNGKRKPRSDKQLHSGTGSKF